MENNQLNDYVEHEGCLYMHYKGWFYKKGMGGQLYNVLNHALHLILLSKWEQRQIKAATA
jgi:hypothetical protein